MDIKTILVHVDDSKHAAQTIHGACAVAQRFDARLDGFHVVPDITMAIATPGGMPSASLVTGMQEEVVKRATAAQCVFAEEQVKTGFSGAWHRIDARGITVADALGSVVHYVDLLVVGQYDPKEETARDPSLPGDLIVNSGRPVLLIPYGWDGAAFGRRILIGWKETREAARAVFDALPFAKRADAVALATVADERQSDQSRRSLEDIGAALRAHGIETTKDVLAKPADASTSDALMSHAEAIGADMLVAGAFSHSRLREGLFGGVTRSIIERSPYPALLSH
jgi:nucleotide-binding universal stress UspA family protein